MTTVLHQQVLALDARYNANRAPNNPNFRTLYIRRRNQLLRETERNPETWRHYLRTRSQLLQQRYGNIDTVPVNSRTISRTSSIASDLRSNFTSPSILVRQGEPSKSLVGGNTVAENYAFVGVHHIFDQHLDAVTMVKFANNDRSKLCCSSLDGKLSICCLDSSPPAVVAVLKGHTSAVTGFDWSANNDLIVSSSMDGSIRVWNTLEASCLRTINDPMAAQILCCLFQPANNNLLITGNRRGEVRIANVSTGLFMKNICQIGGNILSLASDTNGKNLWIGNDKGQIISILCDVSGNLCRTRVLSLGTSCSVTSLSYRIWISREARDPMLLVNCSDNALCLFRIVDREGTLQLKRKFHNRHLKHFVKSTFCPIISFRQSACVVTGSEDGCIYFFDIEKPTSRACINTLQGHSSPVLGVTFNYDESLLATCDLEGLVIVWKRAS